MINERELRVVFGMMHKQSWMAKE